jgi:hypothetical protein
VPGKNLEPGTWNFNQGLASLRGCGLGRSNLGWRDRFTWATVRDDKKCVLLEIVPFALKCTAIFYWLLDSGSWILLSKFLK